MLPDNLHWKLLGLTVDGVPRSDFISDQLFRITQPKCLNDPFEMQPQVLLEKYSPEDWSEARKQMRKTSLFSDSEPTDEDVQALFLDSYPAGRFDEKTFPGLWPAEITELRPEPFQTISESDAFRARKIREDVRKLLNSAFGILSLTKDPRQSVMWSHYASGHRGIAVGLDCTHHFFSDAGFLEGIEYLPKRVAISSNGGIIRIAGKQIRDGTLPPMQTLLRKHPDWCYEKELRFVVPLTWADKKSGLDDQGEPICLKRIPREAIKAIILGARMGPQHKRDIIAKWREEQNMRDVRLFEAQLSDAEFDLEFREQIRPGP
jgi:hypothetical protein